MELRYYVRSSPDQPEKGPYTLDLLKKSYEQRMLKNGAECRLEGSSTWTSLGTLLEQPLPGSPQFRAFGSETSAAQWEMDGAAERQRRAGSSNVTLGIVMIAAGVLLTLATFAAGSGGGVVFTGLIVFGFIRLVRGAASS